MLLSAVAVLVVAQSSSEIPEGLMNNPAYLKTESNSNLILLKKKLYVCVLDSGYFLLGVNRS